MAGHNPDEALSHEEDPNFYCGLKKAVFFCLNFSKDGNTILESLKWNFTGEVLGCGEFWLKLLVYDLQIAADRFTSTERISGFFFLRFKILINQKLISLPKGLLWTWFFKFCATRGNLQDAICMKAGILYKYVNTVTEGRPISGYA